MNKELISKYKVVETFERNIYQEVLIAERIELPEDYVVINIVKVKNGIAKVAEELKHAELPFVIDKEINEDEVVLVTNGNIAESLLGYLERSSLTFDEGVERVEEFINVIRLYDSLSNALKKILINMNQIAIDNGEIVMSDLLLFDDVASLETNFQSVCRAVAGIIRGILVRTNGVTANEEYKSITYGFIEELEKSSEKYKSIFDIYIGFKSKILEVNKANAITEQPKPKREPEYVTLAKSISEPPRSIVSEPMGEMTEEMPREMPREMKTELEIKNAFDDEIQQELISALEEISEYGSTDTFNRVEEVVKPEQASDDDLDARIAKRIEEERRNRSKGNGDSGTHGNLAKKLQKESPVRVLRPENDKKPDLDKNIDLLQNRLEEIRKIAETKIDDIDEKVDKVQSEMEKQSLSIDEIQEKIKEMQSQQKESPQHTDSGLKEMREVIAELEKKINKLAEDKEQFGDSEKFKQDSRAIDSLKKDFTQLLTRVEDMDVKIEEHKHDEFIDEIYKYLNDYDPVKKNPEGEDEDEEEETEVEKTEIEEKPKEKKQMRITFRGYVAIGVCLGSAMAIVYYLL